MSEERAMAEADLWEGEMTSVLLRGRRVLLVKVDGCIRAYADRCAHLGVRLSEGRLAGTRLTCRAHGWEFDVATGRGINPACESLRPLPAAVRDGAVFVELEEEP